MAILTWQNVPTPDLSVGQQGVHTAGDLLNRALGSATAGLNQLQSTQDAQKAAQVTAADRFVQEKMLAAQDPTQARATLASIMSGPAAGLASTDALAKAEGRQDLLAKREVDTFNFGRSKVLAGQQDKTWTDAEALEARRKQQEAGLSAAYAKAIRTGDRRVVQEWLATNPDFAMVGEQAKTLESFLNHREDLNLRWGALNKEKKGKEYETTVKGLAGSLMPLVGSNRIEYLRQLNAVPKEFRYDVEKAVGDLAPAELKAWLNTPGAANAPADGGGGGGASSLGSGGPGGPRPVNDLVDRKLQQEIDKVTGTEGARLLKDAEKYKGKSDADLIAEVAKYHGTDNATAAQFVERLREETKTGDRKLPMDQVTAILTQPGVFTKEGILDWSINVMKASAARAGFGHGSDAIDLDSEKGNLDYDAGLAGRLADSVRGGKAGLEGNQKLEKDQADYRRAVSKARDLQSQIQRTQDSLTGATGEARARLQRSLADLQGQMDREQGKADEIELTYGKNPETSPAPVSEASRQLDASETYRNFQANRAAEAQKLERIALQNALFMESRRPKTQEDLDRLRSASSLKGPGPVRDSTLLGPEAGGDAQRLILSALQKGGEAERQLVLNAAQGGGQAQAVLDALKATQTTSNSQEGSGKVDQILSPGGELPKRYEAFREPIARAAEKHGIPPEILFAIVRKESDGRVDVTGSDGHGQGPFQIDDRYHADWLAKNENGRDLDSAADYAASLMADNLKRTGGDMEKALVLYNASPKRMTEVIARGEHPDAATTGGNYSRSALAYAEQFKPLLDQTKGNERVDQMLTRATGVFVAPGAESLKTPPVVPGNIDLSNRPQVRNKDGSISTVLSMSIGTDEVEVLVPRVTPDGRVLTEKQAIAEYERTGKHLGIFPTVKAANEYAELLHVSQARQLLSSITRRGLPAEL